MMSGRLSARQVTVRNAVEPAREESPIAIALPAARTPIPFGRVAVLPLPPLSEKEPGRGFGYIQLMALMLNDDALWCRVRDADAEAFGSLFERHGQAIYNYCFRATADWGEAEDLASIVFLEAWRHRHQRLEPGKVLAWLYGIATNVIRNYRRSRRRFEAALARLALPELNEDPMLERIDDERQIAALLVQMAHLPRRQRDVIALCDWSGLDYSEASVALGVPVGTVKLRLSRARKALRELNQADGHEEREHPLRVDGA